jgi:hypothetical protein
MDSSPSAGLALANVTLLGPWNESPPANCPPSSHCLDGDQVDIGRGLRLVGLYLDIFIDCAEPRQSRSGVRLSLKVAVIEHVRSLKTVLWTPCRCANGDSGFPDRER